MSSAPRPQTHPSRSSPANGGNDHSAASARTTSVWERKSRVGPLPPGRRATRFARSGVRASRRQWTPVPSRYARSSSAAAVSFPGGLVVSTRINRRSRSVTSPRRSVADTGRSILGRMPDLFSDAAARRAGEVAPLAVRLRPRTLAEFVGQRHVLGEGSALRRAIEEDRVPSSIFYGPPGSGKTTLARIVAASTGAAFEELSAVSATVGDVRAVLARAQERLGASGRRTILFLDEIHRFNKAQQDALLPAVESGLLTLIGATTENPYYEVNSALISRMQVYELEPLRQDELAEIVRRGAAELGIELDAELGALVAQRAGGDARSALNILELAAETARAAGSSPTAAHVEDAARKPPLVYDKAGDAHYDFASAFIKSLRGGDARGRRGRPLHRPQDDRARLGGHRQRRPARPPRRRCRGAGGGACRTPRGAAEPGPGGDLPRARPEVERELRGPQPRPGRRARAGRSTAAEGAARRLLAWPPAGSRRGLRLPARRSARLRCLVPACGGRGPPLLRAVRQRRRDAPRAAFRAGRWPSQPSARGLTPRRHRLADPAISPAISQGSDPTPTPPGRSGHQPGVCPLAYSSRLPRRPMALTAISQGSDPCRAVAVRATGPLHAGRRRRRPEPRRRGRRRSRARATAARSDEPRRPWRSRTPRAEGRRPPCRTRAARASGSPARPRARDRRASSSARAPRRSADPGP